MTFTQWRFAVDAALTEIAGVIGDDLPDWGYYDAWCEDHCPREVALDVLAEAGYMV